MLRLMQREEECCGLLVLGSGPTEHTSPRVNTAVNYRLRVMMFTATDASI